MGTTSEMGDIRHWRSLVLGAAVAYSGTSMAETSSPPLSVGAGVRRVGASQDEAGRHAEQELLDLEALLGAGEAKRQAPTHKRGPRPKVPRGVLPDDVPLSQPNAKARRAIALGPTDDEHAAGPAEATLMALRDAERVLFPEPVNGLSSNWSFALPEREDGSERVLGLPLHEPKMPSEQSLATEDLTWLKSLTMPDLPVRLDRRVVTYLKFYRDNPRGKAILAIWTRKSGKYVAEMKAQLRRAGLPTDLVWLSMIESGHNPTIASPAGAVGLWQFMPDSGRMYGLTVDKWVDERRDPARSTQAAVRFLSDLYRRFGNWELAMGAYNMGYAGMSRSVAKFNTNDYWALSRMESGLPWETTLYVPKICALAIAMNNREVFGVAGTKLEAPVTFDTILVEPATRLKDAALAARLSIEDLNTLNPQYLSGKIPPQQNDAAGRWPLRVPKGRGPSTLGRLTKTKGGERFETYVARLGDTLSWIADDFAMSEATLRSQNGLNESIPLAPGTVLLLPPDARRSQRALERPVEVVASRTIFPDASQRRVFYRVTGGESLEEVARAFSVSSLDLARWNLINTQAHLREGMTLQVLVDKDAALEDVRVIEESSALVFLAGSPEFHEHHEAQKGKRRVTILVRKGDTLASLGARYGMTVGSMERVNRVSRASKLVEGQQLIVYTDRKVSGSSDLAEAGALPALEAPFPELLP